MTAIDTNVLVRILTRDDPEQAERASALLDEERIEIPVTVILETEWVLRYSYGLPPAKIVSVFQAILGTPGIEIDGRDEVQRATRLHACGVDFADALHLSLAGRRAGRFCTFDKAFARSAKDQADPVVVLL